MILRDLSLDNIIGQIKLGVSTRHSLNNFYETMAFCSQTGPKNVCNALKDENWISVMHEELN